MANVRVSGIPSTDEEVEEIFEETDPEELEVNDSALPSSVLHQLRTRAHAQQMDRQIDIPVGGEFKNWLMLRYKPLRPEVLDVFLARRDEAEAKVTALNMDLIARGCVAVIGHNPETGEKQILSVNGKQVGLDSDLLSILDIPAPPGPCTARDVIMLLFGNNGMAIGDHGDKVTTWMRDPVSGNLGEV